MTAHARQPGGHHVPEAFDHLVYATSDLRASLDELAGWLGVRPGAGGQHVGFGTRNALLALGPDAYLEVIAPDPDQPHPSSPRVFGLDERREPGIVAWARRDDDLRGRRARAEAHDVDLGMIFPMSRHLPDGRLLRWHLLFPALPLAGGLVPFFIDWGSNENPARTAAPGCRLLELRGEARAPHEARALLEAVGVDLEVVGGDRDGLVATIETPRGEVVLR